MSSIYTDREEAKNLAAFLEDLIKQEETSLAVADSYRKTGRPATLTSATMDKEIARNIAEFKGALAKLKDTAEPSTPSKPLFRYC